MKKVTLGQTVDNFTSPVTSNKEIQFANLKGKNVILYFYPKDKTPGCTIESCGFRDYHTEFNKLNTVILGVSRDSLMLHESFKEKYNLPFELISDENEQLCQQFDVIKMKSFFGKQIRGIQRSTFLIDKNGILQREWRKVKIVGHVKEVLQAVKDLM